MENPYIVNTDKIAEMLGKTRQRVNQLEKEGVLKKEAAGKWDLAKNAKMYIAYLENNRQEIDIDLEREKLQADVDFKRHKADMAELELEELKGNMHSAEDVKSITTDLVMTIRSNLISLPGQLAVDVVQAETAAEASAILSAAVNEVLDELSNYTYDPAEYRRKVRERQGWKAIDEKEIE